MMANMLTIVFKTTAMRIEKCSTNFDDWDEKFRKNILINISWISK